MMKKIIYLIFTVVAIWPENILNAQGGYTLSQITPKSPNVASFEKYGDIPVSLSTGLTAVSIPLTSIKVDGLTIPISLSYHNNGLKVDEIPSWVGLGWDLQAGGMISYQQRGIRDFDSQYGVIGNPSSYQDLSNFLQGNMTSDQSFNYLERVIQEQEDSQFDLYNINFLGYSGTFYFDNNLQAHITPKSDIKISKTQDGLEITDSKGNQFYFETPENATMYPLSDVEIRPSFNSISSFYISKIITTNGRVVQFKYKSYNLQYNRSNQSVVFHPYVTAGCPSNSEFYGDSYISTDFLLPDLILFDEGVVKFLTSAMPRKDILKINGNDNIPSLTGVIVSNNNGKIINQFNLSQGYFGNYDRLKLTSIQEQNGMALGRNWQFGYYGDDSYAFPEFFSKSKDHWGFFNGKVNSNLIPEADYPNIFLNWVDYLNGGYADRTSDFNSAQLSLLKSIKYPTGGTTTFQYEPNQISVDKYTDITSLSPFLKLPTGTLVKTNIVSDWTNVQHVTGNGDEHTVSGTFTIPEKDIYDVRIYQDVDPTAFESPIINFTGPTESVSRIFHLLSQHTTQNSLQGEGNIILEAGTYTYSLTSGVFCNNNTGNCIPLQANFDISKWVQPSNVPVKPYVIGGCRIAKITSIDNSGVNPDLVKRFVYDDKLGDVVFRNIPSYYNQSTVGFMLTGNVCKPCGVEYIIHDENVRPLTGSNIEYVNVTELDDSKDFSAKTENTFMTSTDEGGSIYGEPLVAPLNTSWQMGNLLSQKKYKYSNSNYSLVETINNGYFTSSKQSLINGIKVDYRYSCPAISSLWTQHGVSLATVFTQQFYQNQNLTSEYLDGTISKTTNVSCQSSFHVLPTLTENYNSKSQSIREKIVYSFDYNASGALSTDAVGIQNLIYLHILIPIEKIQIKTVNGTDFVTGGNLITYRSDKPEIYKSYSLKLSEPLAYASFVQSYINGTGDFVKDTHYEERVSYNKYDGFSNLLDISKSGDNHISFVYDYKSVYPVAEVVNAGSTAIAYSSFESDGTGNWAGINILNIQNDLSSITGAKDYLLNGSTLQMQLDPSLSYIVSYWSKNGSYNVNGTPARQGQQVSIKGQKWTYFEHVVTGTSVALSGTGIIDELRLYPTNAQMTTFTYEPLVGMTSQCDINSKITYYEYDALNRVNLVRDQDQNILKKICYNYSGQPESCGIDDPIWQSTGVTRCQPCPGNNSYNSNIQEHEEKDNNPNSRTYNTSRWVSDGISSNCAIQADWQNTATNLRCAIANGQNTGAQEREQADMNPCSATYNQLRWVTAGANCSICPKPASWQVTGNLRCIQDANAENTGYQEREEKDMESCSSTYNQLRWVGNGYNVSACPLPCNSNTCSGLDKRCVNGVCETGTKIYTASEENVGGVGYTCTYHYEWSDGAWSPDFYEQSGGQCPIF